MTPSQTLAMPAAVRTPRSRAYAGYVLAILVLANCFNAMDRSIITILIEPIRHDLRLDDTQIGLITGFGYALFYTLATIPVARLVDRGNRKGLLATGVAVWSVMTALTGWATGFFTLLMARMAVGASEATCVPNAFSLISDYFEKSKRPRAIAIFQLGTYGGIIFGAVATSKIAATHGWRGAFGILGLPGLALAVLVLLTLREPKRGMSEPDGAPALTPQPAGLGAMVKLLRADAGFGLLVAASVLMAIAQIVMGSWVPAFLMRVHGVSQADVGALAGPVIGLGGIAGTLVGGFAGTALARRSAQERAPLWVMLASAPLAVPALLLFLFASPLPLCLVGGALTGFLIALHFGPLVAVTIGRVRPENRGAASSLLVIGQFLLGFGAGPLIVGALSDLLHPRFGETALRWAMLTAPVAVVLACGLAVAAYRRLGATPPPA